MRWLSNAREAGPRALALTRRAAFPACAVLSLLVMAIVGGSNAWRMTGDKAWVFGLKEEPIYCDWFIFLRQAKLFQQNGLIGGLDTAIREPVTRYLIDKAKSLKAADANLATLIGPYCHFYRASTDRLSIVSPPGTGLILSFFPEGRQARLAFIAHSAIIFLALAAVVLTARRWTVPLIAGALGLMCLIGMKVLGLHWSIPPTVPLVFAAGFLTVRLFDDAENRRGTIWAMLLGLTLGLAANVRTANGLLAAGVGIGFGLMFLRGMRMRALGVSAVFAICVIVGYLPTFAANAINAGHPLSSTYAFNNTQALRLDWETVKLGFEFYLLRWDTIVLFAYLSGAALVVLWLMHRKLAVGAAQWIAIVGFTSLAFSMAFFCAYEIRQEYYAFPAVVYAASVAAFLLIRSENSRMRVDRLGSEGGVPFRLGVGLAVFAGTLALLGSITIPLSKNYLKPDIDFSLPPRSVVWASKTGGLFVVLLNRQASALPHFDLASQDLLIRSIAADNVRQFVVADHGQEAAVQRLKQTADLQLVGKAFTYDLYEIKSPPR